MTPRFVIRAGAAAWPQLVAAGGAGVLVGTTAPLLLAGLDRSLDGAVSAGLAVPVVLVWGVAVVLVMNAVPPWRRLIVAGVRREERALAQAQATRREQVAYHARWLLGTSAWAAGLSLPVASAVAAALAVRPGVPLTVELTRGALGAVAGVAVAGASTGYVLIQQRSPEESITLD